MRPILLLVLILTLACGDRQAPASDDPSMESKTVELLENIIDIFTKAGTDCDKLASGLDQFATENQQTFVDIKQWGDRQTSEQKRVLATRNKVRTQGLLTRMGLAMQACGNNPAVAAALKKIRP